MTSQRLSPAANEDDLRLVERVVVRDRQAFEDLYRRYQPRIFAYALRLARRVDLVEEVVNDVLLTVWRSADRFDGRSRVSTWIFGIAYRKTLKALSRARPRGIEDEEATATLPSKDAAGSRATRMEMRSLLGQALKSLSPEHRAVVELTYYYDCSYDEIASIVGCPVNTVKTRMFHARRRLRELLPALGVNGPAME